jgi:hypothetical protein
MHSRRTSGIVTQRSFRNKKTIACESGNVATHPAARRTSEKKLLRMRTLRDGQRTFWSKSFRALRSRRASSAIRESAAATPGTSSRALVVVSAEATEESTRMRDMVEPTSDVTLRLPMMRGVGFRIRRDEVASTGCMTVTRSTTFHFLVARLERRSADYVEPSCRQFDTVAAA